MHIGPGTSSFCCRAFCSCFSIKAQQVRTHCPHVRVAPCSSCSCVHLAAAAPVCTLRQLLLYAAVDCARTYRDCCLLTPRKGRWLAPLWLCPAAHILHKELQGTCTPNHIDNPPNHTDHIDDPPNRIDDQVRGNCRIGLCAQQWVCPLALHSTQDRTSHTKALLGTYNKDIAHLGSHLHGSYNGSYNRTSHVKTLR